MKKNKTPLLVLPIFFLGLGILEFYKTKEFPIDTLAFIIALALLAGAAYLAEKYLAIKNYLNMNIYQIII